MTANALFKAQFERSKVRRSRLRSAEGRRSLKSARFTPESGRVQIVSHARALVLVQATAGPLAPPGPGRVPDGAQVQRRTARMSPLWRIMNSKPFGAYCQSSYECSTGLCR